MRRNNSSKFFNFTERQWDSIEQASCVESLSFPDVKCAVKRLCSGTLQLPRLSCRPSVQDRPEDGSQSSPQSGPESGPMSGSESCPLVRVIKPSRSLGTLTSCISKSL
ncbi:cAMP-specific 3',5'-cyclic phosphodiesterase 4D-like isoform X1 [Lates japonicus]